MGAAWKRASEDSSGDGAEHLPPFRDALQDVGAEILKLDSRAGNQILHCPRNKHVIRATDMGYAGGDVHSNPANVVVADGGGMNLDRDIEFIGEPLQFKFPQTHARAVAAATW
jgi:hypothetical protein